MNFIFISPNFPSIYSHFVKSLHDRGVTVLGIGDTPYDNLNTECKENLTEYCFCSDLGNLQWMKNTVNYLKDKYGPISFLESNNEYWLESDAKLREFANVINGLRLGDMEAIKYKSKMKTNFLKAGCKVARYILVENLEQCEKFIEEVGYPVFSKPDNGVGAVATYKINNHDELVNFINTKPNVLYIMEEFIDGNLISFDGICDDNSDVVIAVNETFPVPIAEIVNFGGECYYYANAEMPEEFRELGKRVVKAFGIKKRCFHIEFFQLKEDKKGLGKKGDILGLEVNMRSPGGNTPDLICIALGANYYDVYADVIVNNASTLGIGAMHAIAFASARKDNIQYKLSDSEILSNYKEQIVTFGKYPPDIARAMGDRFFFGKFKTLDEALKFNNDVLKK